MKREVKGKVFSTSPYKSGDSLMMKMQPEDVYIALVLTNLYIPGINYINEFVNTEQELLVTGEISPSQEYYIQQFIVGSIKKV